MLNCQKAFFPHDNITIEEPLFRVALDVFFYSTWLKNLQSFELNFG